MFSSDPANRLGVVKLYRETIMTTEQIAAHISKYLGCVIKRSTIIDILRGELTFTEYSRLKRDRAVHGAYKRQGLTPPGYIPRKVS